MTAEHAPAWPVLRVSGPLAPDALQDVLGLAAAAAEADGNPPLSEQTLVNLRRPDAAQLVFRTYSSDEFSGDRSEELAGAAVVSFPRADGEPWVVELVVRPTYRNEGVGTALAEAIQIEELPALRAWSHGNHAAAVELAAKFGFAPVRELWRMRQSRAALKQSVPDVVLPDGVALRSFRPGRDEEAWLEANASAFAHHPEQGSMTMQDLLARMAEDWFDPAGLLLAIRKDDGRLLGFHWTKVHPGTGNHPAIGEVYVVGVTPGAQGMGLGRALTVAGIEHLHSHGLQAIMLYVDADNTAAVSLYRKLGFTRWDVDVMYASRVAAVSL